MPDASILALLFIGAVIVQRLVELWLARGNTRRLLARGGREVGASHYPLIVALHTTWLVAILGFGWQAAVSIPWFTAYVVLQLFRVWILARLGSRWTTRIIIVDEPLVRRGPYKFIAHPNYLLVVAEIFVVPMALGLFTIALIFSILNAAVLAVRISREARALAETR